MAANLLSSMVIAMFSGVAIALGFASGISSALSGVALSASLLPPIVNAGLLVVLGWVYPGMRCGPVEPHNQVQCCNLIVAQLLLPHRPSVTAHHSAATCVLS